MQETNKAELNPTPWYRRSWAKIIAALSGIFAVISIAVWVFATFYLEPLIRTALIAAVPRATDSLYVLNLKAVHVTPLTGSIRLEAVSLHMDSAHVAKRFPVAYFPKGPPLQAALTLKNLDINGINWWALGFNKKLLLRRILLIQPDVQMRRNFITPEAQKIADSLKRPFNLEADLPKLILRLGRGVQVDSILIREGTIAMEDARMGKAAVQASQVNLASYGFKIFPDDTASAVQRNRFLFSDNLTISMREFAYTPPDSLYRITVHALATTTRGFTLVADSIRIAPSISDLQFSATHATRKDRLRFYANRLKAQVIDMHRLLRYQELHMGHLTLAGISIDVLDDKRRPRADDFKPFMPHEAARAAPIVFGIDTLTVLSGQIAYNERLADEDHTLRVTFDNVQATLLNVTNDPMRMTYQHPMLVHASARFLNEAMLTLIMQYPLLAPSFQCAYQGGLGSMQAQSFNKMLHPHQRISIVEGQVNNVSFAVNVNNSYATGKMDASYQNLKVSVASKDGTRTSKLGTGLANLIIRNNNEEGTKRNVKKASITYMRQRDDGFFRFLITTMKDGLQKIILPFPVKNKPAK